MKTTIKPGLNIPRAIIYFELGVLGFLCGAWLYLALYGLPPKYETNCYSSVSYDIPEENTLMETWLPAHDYCETVRVR